MTQNNKVIQLSHLVDLCRVVALMAVYPVMHANYPRLVCLVMDMTDRACIGIVLEIIVDLVGCVKGPY